MYTARRLTSIALINVVLLVLALAQPAFPDQYPIGGSASPSPGGNGVDSTVQSGTGSPGQGGGGGGRGQGTVTCTFSPVPAGDPAYPSGSQGGVTDSGQTIPPNTPGTWAFEICRYPDLSVAGLAKLVFLPPGGGGVDPTQLLITARNHLGLPAPPIQLSPAADLWQYVQMPTWAWVPTSTWVPLTTTASAGPVTVTVIATPVRLVFLYQIKGDGSTGTETCNGPGTPYDDQLAAKENPQEPVLAASPDCGWTWHQSSADTPDQKYAVSAHTVYHTLWTIRGAPGGGDLGELSGLDTDVRVTVGEIQALNTAPR